MNKKKWQIEKLNDELQFSSAAILILKDRLLQVLDDIKEYLSKESVEALHKLRISLRRLRYAMELFISCFEKKKFMILYKKVEALQDLSGKTRDYDVMKENLAQIESETKIEINKNVFLTIEKLRLKCYSELRIELMKFIHSKAVKNFETMLNVKI